MYLPWEKYSHSEEFVSRIAELYGPGEARLEQQRSRYAELIERWHRRFGTPGEGLMFFSAPGRTEIGGNHTDHNNGRVLAAAVNLDTVAAVRAREDMTIIVDSEGYPAIEIDCSDTSVHPEETGTTAALIRGTAGATLAVRPDSPVLFLNQSLGLDGLSYEDFVQALGDFTTTLAEWRRLLADYRPDASAPETAVAEPPPFERVDV